MKLIVFRDQTQGMLGGIRFEVRVKCVLTPDEMGLVQKYKAHREVLARKEFPIPLTGRTLSFGLTIGDLIDGHTFKCADINEVIVYESNTRDACQAFKNYLQAMASFGGQETIDFGDVAQRVLEEASFVIDESVTAAGALRVEYGHTCPFCNRKRATEKYQGTFACSTCANAGV